MRAASGAPVVLAGDGEGMVDAAAVGLLDRPGLVLYSAALSPEELQQALADGADLVVTDTNRLRGLRWGGLRDNHGPTVAPGEVPLREDPYAQDLSPFADRSDDTRTIASRVGVAKVEATSSGQPLWYTPEDRAGQRRRRRRPHRLAGRGVRHRHRRAAPDHADRDRSRPTGSRSCRP